MTCQGPHPELHVFEYCRGTPLNSSLKSLNRGDRPIVALPLTIQMANKLSALDTIAGAVRVTRFAHSNMSGYDSTGINTEDFKMEYVVNFEGAGRPSDLPLMSFERLDSVDCGKHCCVLTSVVIFAEIS